MSDHDLSDSPQGAGVDLTQWTGSKKWISSWGQREGEAFWGNMGVPSSTAWA